MTTYLKALGPNRECINGGKGSWPEPGVWTEPIPPIDGHRGWHVCTPGGMVADWLPDTRHTLWEVEIIGHVAFGKNKQAVEQARLVRRMNWTDQTARLFAADCAEAALDACRRLPAWLTLRPDPVRRRRLAIEVARRYAYDEIDHDELRRAWAAIRYHKRTPRHRRMQPVAASFPDQAGLYGLPPLWRWRRGGFATHCAELACAPIPRAVDLARLTYRAAINAGADPEELADLFLRNIQPPSDTPEPVTPSPPISVPTNPNLEVHQP